MVSWSSVRRWGTVGARVDVCGLAAAIPALGAGRTSAIAILRPRRCPAVGATRRCVGDSAPLSGSLVARCGRTASAEFVAGLRAWIATKPSHILMPRSLAGPMGSSRHVCFPGLWLTAPAAEGAEEGPEGGGPFFAQSPSLLSSYPLQDDEETAAFKARDSSSDEADLPRPSRCIRGSAAMLMSAQKQAAAELKAAQSGVKPGKPLGPLPLEGVADAAQVRASRKAASPSTPDSA